MLKIEADIAQLEQKLSNPNCKNPKILQENLAQTKYLLRLWRQFAAIPTAQLKPSHKTKYITANFNPIGPDGAPSLTERQFRAGTPIHAILLWFESRFCISVLEEFGPAANGIAMDGA